MSGTSSLSCSRVEPPTSTMSKLHWLFFVFTLALAGCGSPLVGLECKAGLERCGGGCFNLSVDVNHCGSCDVSCGGGEQCVESMCIAQDPDAGRDAGEADADAGDAATPDGGPTVPLPPRCTGPGSAESCVCGLGQIKCGDTCRNVGSDPNNCGACDNSCGPGAFCVGGMCLPACEPPLTQCGPLCVDLQTDPHNCGSCGNVCESGICSEGECIGPTAGHLVAMGQDLTSNTAATRRLLGNAVFLPLADPVQVLVFDEKASPQVKAGVESALMTMASVTGRRYEPTTVTSLAVTFLLSMSDVFLIEAQSAATNEQLVKNGETWSLALQEFLKRGGVIVLMDGPGGSNDGTYQILKAAGLFDAAARVPIGRKPLTLAAPSDAVATAVPTIYQGGVETVGFDITASTVVVKDDATGTPVVIHIAR